MKRLSTKPGQSRERYPGNSEGFLIRLQRKGKVPRTVRITPPFDFILPDRRLPAEPGPVLQPFFFPGILQFSRAQLRHGWPVA